LRRVDFVRPKTLSSRERYMEGEPFLGRRNQKKRGTRCERTSRDSSRTRDDRHCAPLPPEIRFQTLVRPTPPCKENAAAGEPIRHPAGAGNPVVSCRRKDVVAKNGRYALLRWNLNDWRRGAVATPRRGREQHGPPPIPFRVRPESNARRDPARLFLQ
jgi:hypothetical protein